MRNWLVNTMRSGAWGHFNVARHSGCHEHCTGMAAPRPAFADHADRCAAATALQRGRVWTAFVFDRDHPGRAAAPGPAADSSMPPWPTCMPAPVCWAGWATRVRSSRPWRANWAWAPCTPATTTTRAALARRCRVAAALPCPLHTCKDHVVLERAEVLTAAGRPTRLHALQECAWLQRLRPSTWPIRGAARTPGARPGRAARPVRPRL